MADETLETVAVRTAGTPAPIVLRWEWRSFAHKFGEADERLAKLTPSATTDSDEVYFLSAHGQNVKIRDALMDVKVLREVNRDGLQQWAPVMKSEFPLSAIDAVKVIDALDVPVKAGLRESYGMQAFIDAFNRADSGVRVVEVHKRRVRYTVEDCMAELSEITANGRSTRTVAVESVDPEAVMRAVNSLGLTGYINTSYLKGLSDLIEGIPERYAVIDVGTNSIKFHVGELRGDGTWTAIADRAELTRLGEGLAKTRRISDTALDRTASAIAGMAAEAKREGVRAIAVVGTAGLRTASNAAEVVSAIRERTGVGVEVISGDEEARLAYLATIAALGPAAGKTVVFDTGGGSSQFTFGTGKHVHERFSVDVGAARYSEQFGLDRAVSLDTVHQAMEAISGGLARLDGREPPATLIGMGGGVTNITAVAKGLAKYDPAVVQGAVIDAQEVDRQVELYRSRDAEGRRTIVGLQPKRAEVILAGACIVRTLMQKLGKDRLTVSDRGLRHGLLAERFGDQA
ncbi:hypothetical protein LZ016_00580 [Sphingomonas sp. SM33]|uniref:Ppx/GppA phosphatase N-terminal domain-containing protein n=1 Tax=Sphingomonas telluris TaxID=2907998 RepID=A0ABS9VI19_9SPHN|nr:hypothetical protein [Sphingomonas telluris]MCH8614603.1 hypothetical protein [Sphingomonas telluris]